MKTTTWFGLVTLLAVPALSGLAQVPPDGAPGTSAQTGAGIPDTLSPGAAEVVRLATSGIGDDVVLSYIRNSQAPFNLSANDVLYLKDIGLSPEVTSAMLSHDSTLRGQPQQYAPARAAPAPTAPAPTAPPAPAPVTAPAPVYVSSAPADVTYFYNDLAPYGSWVQLEGYGWCWQPTTVVITPGWRPYCDGGYWVYSDLGWYWQSTYSWGWAPFHYGRWYRHARCGWVWLPDRVWGPAWVTWRTSGDVCGWAPLPPRAEFDVRLGWRFNGVTVGANFGFGLGSDAFLFVSFGDFCAHDLHRRCLPPARVTTIYRQTTIINNYVVNNNRIVHRGIPLERVSAVSRVAVPRANVREWSAAPGRMPTRGGTVVYRTRLEAPARPVRMEAQRIDAQHPVIRHTPSAQTPGGAARRQTLEPPKASPWSPAAGPGSSQRTQSAPGTPSGKAPPTSNWSRDARPAAPQVQSTPSASQSVPTIPPGPSTPRAPDNWKQGARNAPGYRSDAGLPALYNSRSETQPAPAAGQGASQGSSPHFYTPKSGRQAAEIRSLPRSDTGSSDSRPSREGGSDSRSRRDK